jgi:hypothetical protein
VTTKEEEPKSVENHLASEPSKATLSRVGEVPQKPEFLPTYREKTSRMFTFKPKPAGVTSGAK